MEFLAIRNTAGKGVYLYEDKKERKNGILKLYSGCSYKTFGKNEKEQALQ